MKAVCAFLALGFVASASALYTEGKHNPADSFLLFARAVTVTFDASHSKYVVQFNTCKGVDVTITEVQLMQYRGQAMRVNKLHGGVNNHLVGLELTGGHDVTNFQFTIWGKWNGAPKDVNHEQAYRIGNQWRGC